MIVNFHTIFYFLTFFILIEYYKNHIWYFQKTHNSCMCLHIITFIVVAFIIICYLCIIYHSVSCYICIHWIYVIWSMFIILIYFYTWIYSLCIIYATWFKETLKGALSDLRQFPSQKPFKNDERYFLFHLKSLFRSQDT